MLYSIDNKWPLESPEKSGRWMGEAHNVGNALTYKILTDDTNKVIYCSAIRPRDAKDPNNCLDIFGGVEADKPIKSIEPFLNSPKKLGSVSELELSVRS